MKTLTTMENVSQELAQIIAEYSARFRAIDTTTAYHKPLPNKWSKKEILGHLTDSAFNNLQRFVKGQYEESPHIIYDQDAWVKIQNYQHIPFNDIVTLWTANNQQLLNVLQHMPEENYDKLCNTGNNADQFHSLLWLAEDYVAHLRHHIRQIIPEE